MKNTIGVMALLLLSLFQPAQAVNSEGLRSFLKRQETRIQAKIGMSIIDAHGEPVFGYRQEQRFPLTSTFKVFACAALLERLQNNTGSLAESVTISPDQLLAYSPVTRDYVAPATITLRQLCAAAISYSDNTAANRILAYLGGPDEVTRFMRRIGDSVTRLDRTEPALNEATPGDIRDTTTPRHIATALYKLRTTSLLTTSHRAELNNWMQEDKVADHLLRAVLPPGWTIADKTGAGGYGSRAIIAAVCPPDQPPFYVAVYITGTGTAIKITDGVIAETGKRLFAEWQKKPQTNGTRPLSSKTALRFLAY